MDKKLIYTQLFFSLLLIVFSSQAGENKLVKLDGQFTSNSTNNFGILLEKISYKNGILMTKENAYGQNTYTIKHEILKLDASCKVDCVGNIIEQTGFGFDYKSWPCQVPKWVNSRVNNVSDKKNISPKTSLDIELVSLGDDFKLVEKKTDKNKKHYLYHKIQYDNGVSMIRDRTQNKGLTCTIIYTENNCEKKITYTRDQNGIEEKQGVFELVDGELPFLVPQSFKDLVSGKNKLDQEGPTPDQKDKMNKTIDAYKKMNIKFNNNSIHNRDGYIGSFKRFGKVEHLKIESSQEEGVLFLKVPASREYAQQTALQKYFTYAYLFANEINYGNKGANSTIGFMTGADDYINKCIREAQLDRNGSADDYINYLKNSKGLYNFNEPISRDSEKKGDKLFLILNSIVFLKIDNNCNLEQGSEHMELFLHLNKHRIEDQYAFVLMMQYKDFVFQCLVNKAKVETETVIEIVTGQRIPQDIKNFLINLLVPQSRDFLPIEIIKLELKNQHPECVKEILSPFGIPENLIDSVVKKEDTTEIKEAENKKENTEENKALKMAKQAFVLMKVVLKYGNDRALPRLVAIGKMTMNGTAIFFKQSFKLISGAVMLGALWYCLFFVLCHLQNQC